MDNKEKRILQRLKFYRIYNNIIPKFIKDKLLKTLTFLNVPPHTIGVFFNPNTSPFEQYDIIKYFMNRNDKTIRQIIQNMK